MNDQTLLRYSRHILLEEFGVEGQEKLEAACALVVGAGGLGCPAAQYLASAGVGTIRIADPDRIDLTNLQRQVIYRTAQVGEPKAIAACTALGELNPTIRLEPLVERLSGEALDRQVRESTIVLDCSDNFATRHEVNRACVRHRRALVSGAAIRFDGQIASFDLRDPQAPCYNCLFPESSEAADELCSVMGVIAPLTGTIGAMQALEAIKLLIGLQGGAETRLTLFEARDGTWRSLRIRRDPACAVCAGRTDSPAS